MNLVDAIFVLNGLDRTSDGNKLLEAVCVVANDEQHRETLMESYGALVRLLKNMKILYRNKDSVAIDVDRLAKFLKSVRPNQV